MGTSAFRLYFITASPELAKFVCDRGVDRIFVDLEIDGKVERQGHLSTVISRHTFEDVAIVRRAVPDAELLVRLNPPGPNSCSEVAKAIELGADIVMLPMFRTAAEVRSFTSCVAGRAQTCLLVETIDAANNLDDIVRIDGVDEVHIGLNDLHLDLGQDFMFEPLANGLVDAMAGTLRANNVPFGIGGIARCGEGLLPPELILGEHRRLGSTGAILSRTFHRNLATVEDVAIEMDVALEIAKLRQAYDAFQHSSASEFASVHRKVQEHVATIVAQKRLSNLDSKLGR
jgi:hypothetical protein